MARVFELKGLVLCHANNPAFFQPATRMGASFQRTGPLREKRNPNRPWVSRNDDSFKSNGSLEKECHCYTNAINTHYSMEYMYMHVCIFLFLRF